MVILLCGWAVFDINWVTFRSNRLYLSLVALFFGFYIIHIVCVLWCLLLCFLVLLTSLISPPHPHCISLISPSHNQAFRTYSYNILLLVRLFVLILTSLLLSSCHYHAFLLLFPSPSVFSLDLGFCSLFLFYSLLFICQLFLTCFFAYLLWDYLDWLSVCCWNGIFF